MEFGEENVVADGVVGGFDEDDAGPFFTVAGVAQEFCLRFFVAVFSGDEMCGVEDVGTEIVEGLGLCR